MRACVCMCVGCDAARWDVMCGVVIHVSCSHFHALGRASVQAQPRGNLRTDGRTAIWRSQLMQRRLSIPPLCVRINGVVSTLVGTSQLDAWRHCFCVLWVRSLSRNVNATALMTLVQLSHASYSGDVRVLSSLCARATCASAGNSRRDGRGLYFSDFVFVQPGPCVGVARFRRFASGVAWSPELGKFVRESLSCCLGVGDEARRCSTWSGSGFVSFRTWFQRVGTRGGVESPSAGFPHQFAPSPWCWFLRHCCRQFVVRPRLESTRDKDRGLPPPGRQEIGDRHCASTGPVDD